MVWMGYFCLPRDLIMLIILSWNVSVLGRLLVPFLRFYPACINTLTQFQENRWKSSSSLCRRMQTMQWLMCVHVGTPRLRLVMPPVPDVVVYFSQRWLTDWPAKSRNGCESGANKLANSWFMTGAFWIMEQKIRITKPKAALFAN